MIFNERDLRHELVMEVIHRMMSAARTAPKGKGVDVIEVAAVTNRDIRRISDELINMNHENGMNFLLRDAENILQAEAILLIGTHQLKHGLNCGHCGFPTCESKPDEVPCAINSVDVGIAIGSAVATAADMRADTRVMYSAGMAAQRLGILGDCKCVFAIPVSASNKNPFFDRKPKQIEDHIV